MIEVNLIPDVKQEFLRAQSMRNKVISLSIIISIVAVGLIVALGLVLGTETVRDALADSSIKSEYKKLQSVDNIEDLLTIQNQLSEISNVSSQKAITSRMFDVLAAINPAAPNNVRMTSINIDPSSKTLTIEGSASNSFTATDAFKKTILNTTLQYTRDGASATDPLTSDVTLSDASYGTDASGARVLQFKLSFVYPDALFSNTVSGLKVVSPTGSVDVTDSRLRVPDSLFNSSSSQGGTN